MRDDRLKALFDQADAPPGPPRTGPGELASRVRALYQRRQQRRIRAVAFIAIIALSALYWQSNLWRQGLHPDDGMIAQPPKSVPAVSEAQIAAAKAELEQARREIEREQRIVERLLAAERLDRVKNAAGQMEIVPERQTLVAEQVGRAALAMLVAADQKRGWLGLQASAQENYACVIDLFPNTPWADEARQRLAALGP